MYVNYEKDFSFLIFFLPPPIICISRFKILGFSLYMVLSSFPTNHTSTDLLKHEYASVTWISLQPYAIAYSVMTCKSYILRLVTVLKYVLSDSFWIIRVYTTTRHHPFKASPVARCISASNIILQKHIFQHFGMLILSTLSMTHYLVYDFYWVPALQVPP